MPLSGEHHALHSAARWEVCACEAHESCPPTIASAPTIIIAVALVGLALFVVVSGVRRYTGRHEVSEADAAADTSGPGGAIEPTNRRITAPTPIEPTNEPAAGSPSVPMEQAPTATPIFDSGSEVDQMLAQAQRLAETDAAEARRVLQQLLERFPRDERVLTALATSLDGSDDDRASEIARRCLEVNVSNVRCNAVTKQSRRGGLVSSY